jgi:hypothetical protein
MNAGCFSKISCANVLNFAVSSPPLFPLPHTPLPLDKNRAYFCSSLIEMTTGAIQRKYQL